MFNLQGSEIIVILLIALVVLGPERLPDAVRRFMHTYNELKKMGSGFQSEIRSAFDEPMNEMRKTADMVRDAADPNRIVAEAEAEQRLRDDAAAATPVVGLSANGDHDDTADEHTPDSPAVDPGSETVATPGSAPPPPPEPPPARSRIEQSSTPPPPPPPFSASKPAEPSTSTSASDNGSVEGATPAPPPPPIVAPVTVIDPPPLPRRRPEDG